MATYCQQVKHLDVIAKRHENHQIFLLLRTDFSTAANGLCKVTQTAQLFLTSSFSMIFCENLAPK